MTKALLVNAIMKIIMMMMMMMIILATVRSVFQSHVLIAMIKINNIS